MVLREEKAKALAAKEKAETTALAAATLASFVENLGKILVKAYLFDKGLRAATGFNGMAIQKFVQIIIKY